MTWRRRIHQRRSSSRSILGLALLYLGLSLFVQSAHALNHLDADASTCLVCHLLEGTDPDLNQVNTAHSLSPASQTIGHVTSCHRTAWTKARPWVRGPPTLIL